MDDLSLGAEFPTPTRDAWLALVEKTLKGADYSKTLVSRTHDGIAIEPLYTRADATTSREMPGQAPFTRGGTAAGGWLICQAHDLPNPADCNASILAELEAGATALAVRLAGTDTNGTFVVDLDDVAALLDGIRTDAAPVYLETRENRIAAASALLRHVAGTGQGKTITGGHLGVDPAGELAATGSLDQPFDTALAQAADLAHRTITVAPGLRTLVADTRMYHAAGASEAQEVGAALATGLAYLRGLEAAGIALDAAAGQIGFLMTADADFFLTIAKIRAARRLWAKVTAACGIDAAAMDLRVETASRMMTRVDPWVNMLRTTVASFAAGIAGAQAVTVLPYSAATGPADGFARRIARNTQIILQEESSLARVADPAGGSWYLEELTGALEARAWDVLQDIEGQGGIAPALMSGHVQLVISETSVARQSNIAHRREALTGASEFPNLQEAPADVADVDWTAARSEAAARMTARGQTGKAAGDVPAPGAGELTDHVFDALRSGAGLSEIGAALSGDSVHADRLPAIRLAQDFEDLRASSDAFVARNGHRPRVFLANLGRPAEFTARATFARNLFEAGGIEAVTNNGFADETSLAAAFEDSGAELAVICSSDGVYEARASAAAEALAGAGAKKIYLAGRPGDREAADEAAGISGYVFAGCNAVEFLAGAQDFLGVREQ